MMRRSNPFGDIEAMFERMSRQFGEMNRQFDSWSGHQGMSSGMTVDVADYDGEIVVTADVPGFEKEDIDISLSERTLTIRAEREMEREHESDAGEYLRRERGHSAMSRSIRLPVAVDEDEASASYTNGVLTVTLPKFEREEGEDSHHIDVN